MSFLQEWRPKAPRENNVISGKNSWSQEFNLLSSPILYSLPFMPTSKRRIHDLEVSTGSVSSIFWSYDDSFWKLNSFLRIFPLMRLRAEVNSSEDLSKGGRIIKKKVFLIKVWVRPGNLSLMRSVNPVKASKISKKEGSFLSSSALSVIFSLIMDFFY